MDALRDREIVGAGTSEADWQGSGVLDAIPSTTFAQLMDRSSRLVVVAPHPDDEVLACGGLIAQAVCFGIPVLVVAVSDGELCYPDHPMWTPGRLRTARTKELQRALATLGVDESSIVRLSMNDGSIADEEESLTLVLTDILRSSDAVLAPWSRDGHPDHEAACVAALSAVANVGCRFLQYPVWAWHWMRPEQHEWTSPLLRRLELSAHVQRLKLASISCFETQTGVGHPEINEPVLPPHVLERFERSFEVFFL